MWLPSLQNDIRLSFYCCLSHKEVAEANFALHETHCSRFLCLCPDCNESVPRDQLKDHREEQHAEVQTRWSCLFTQIHFMEIISEFQHRPQSAVIPCALVHLSTFWVSACVCVVSNLHICQTSDCSQIQSWEEIWMLLGGISGRSSGVKKNKKNTPYGKEIEKT